jgi:hypothetical protein
MLRVSWCTLHLQLTHISNPTPLIHAHLTPYTFNSGSELFIAGVVFVAVVMGGGVVFCALKVKLKGETKVAQDPYHPNRDTKLTSGAPFTALFWPSRQRWW